MMWYWGSGYGWGMTVIGILMMLVFWGGIFALAVLVMRSIGGQRIGQRDAAMDALRKRLASGEITPEEYERVRKVLLG